MFSDCAEDYARQDETDDALFYGTDRFVSHLDAVALGTVERVIGRLLVEESPSILDLMASWDSHLPAGITPSRVVGLGLNRNELLRNERLTEIVVHDLNRSPTLPFGDNVFDAVINTVSVDYMTRPREVFAEVCRVLKPHGLFLVLFSNRMFPEKAVRIWRESSESERAELVVTYFEQAEGFKAPRAFSSIGKPRPEDDKYAGLGLPSDPVYAVYAEKSGEGEPLRARPELIEEQTPPLPARLSDERMRQVRQSLACPHCGRKMKKWATPNHPFSTWDIDYLYACFNDACPFLVRGWRGMRERGNAGLSCRFMYNPFSGGSISIPIIGLNTLKEGIIEEGDDEG